MKPHYARTKAKPVYENGQRRAPEVFCFFSHGGANRFTRRTEEGPDGWFSLHGTDKVVTSLPQFRAKTTKEPARST